MPINQFPVRVFWEDTDAGGIVYHANYLKFMERARSDLLCQLAFDQNQERGRKDGILFVVASLDIAYRKAAVLGDHLTVHTRVEKIRRASIVFEQNIMRGEELITAAHVRIGVINAVSLLPTAIPQALYNKLQSFSETESFS